MCSLIMHRVKSQPKAVARLINVLHTLEGEHVTQLILSSKIVEMFLRMNHERYCLSLGELQPHMIGRGDKIFVRRSGHLSSVSGSVYKKWSLATVAVKHSVRTSSFSSSFCKGRALFGM